MIDMGSIWSEFWANLSAVTNTIALTDLLDVLIVAFLVYEGIRLVRETRAMQLLKGIAFVFVLYFVAVQLNMITLTFLINNIMQWGIVALAVLFQPEIRRALEQVGRSNITVLGRLGAGDMDEKQLQEQAETVKAVCESAAYLSERRIGALIVIERQTKLGEIIKTGTVIDSKASLELICNVFFPNSPLHDGAMIIRGGRLHAAGCFLPLSANSEIGRELGTRHRAALGMSEQSDAVVVVVSEETGAITVAMDSRLQRRLSPQNLEKLLTAKLLGKAHPAEAERGEEGEQDKNKENDKGKGKKKSFWRSSK